MNYDIKIAVIGGDMRLCALAEAAAADGFECAVWGVGECNSGVRCADVEDAMGGASAVILPIPVTRDGVRLFAPCSSEGGDMRLTCLASVIPDNAVVFGGLIPRDIKSAFDVRKIKTFDYYEDESVKIESAVQTAEGAVGIAIRELPVTLRGSDILVAGYGRVGRALSSLLVTLGANVTVAARKKSDMVWAESTGCRTFDDYAGLSGVGSFDAVFNTVPVRLFDRETLKAQSGAIYVELASSPGGASEKEVKDAGVRYIPAPSLPGRTSPKSAGRSIYRSVKESLQKEGML